MKRYLMLMGLVGFLFAVGCSQESSNQEAKAEATLASTEVIVCDVEGMTCTGCETPVALAIKKLDGVEEVNISFKTGTAEVTVDPKRITEEDIIAAINKSGFKGKKRPAADGS